MKSVLLAGDSISIDYRKYLFPMLADRINIFGRDGNEEAYKNLDKAIGSNCGDSSQMLEYVKMLKENGGLNVDYFVFNCGLHDLRTIKATNEHQVSLELYEKNLSEIITLAKNVGASCIFINTTPIVSERYPERFSYTRYDSDVDSYNDTAIKVMKRMDVPVIDLNSFVKSCGPLDDTMFRDHAHFTDERIIEQAQFLKTKLEEIID